MGKVTRKRYSAEFKSKVALEAIKGDQGRSDIGGISGQVLGVLSGVNGIFATEP